MTTRNLFPLAADAIDALGRNDFYDRLLEMMGKLADHSLAALVRYSRHVPPDLIIPRIEPNETIMSYYRQFYRMDPYYRHWAAGGDTGVYRLRAMTRGAEWTRYAREFLSPMAIFDEIAVFLPPIGEASPTLILDRTDAPFTAAEVARVKALFPLLAALHRRHLSVFVTAGIDLGTSPFGQERPLRLVDQHGRQIFATHAWMDTFMNEDATLQESLALVSARGPCMQRLPGGRVLRRTRLPQDFGPAPGGYCDEITPDPGMNAENGVPGLPETMAAQLTEREQDVVRLTLHGYPVIEIARKLGLSRGTVKNYRLAIYRKLDITTERELFGEYIRSTLGG